jgi:spore maturation protein CgeB
LEFFLNEGKEILVARDGKDVVDHIRTLTWERAKAVGEAAQARILAEHTYMHRGAMVDSLLQEQASRKRERSIV